MRVCHVVRGAAALAASATRKVVAGRGLSTASPTTGVSDATQKERLIIFDTTLRDGEQSPGCTLQTASKVAIAHSLCSLGVDVCEAGFPVASPGDFEAVSTIAREVGPRLHGRERPMIIAGLARAMQKDIDRCFEAVRHAPLHRIHTFLATSDLHLQHKLGISRQEAIVRAVRAVTHARSLCSDVEFSTEDAGRSDKQFLCEIIGAVIEAGASTINVPDTVGYTLPHEYGALFSYLIAHTPGADRVVWSTHCHNDLGLATANTLAAVMAGARQVEVTVNGIGERAGNTALEEVVMTIATRPQMFPVRSTVDTTQITKSSRMVQSLTGMPVQAHKAVVGANAFAHESGIHQDGMLKNKSTYEIMTPESVGLLKSSLVLGKHSGRAAFKDRLRDLGFVDIPGPVLDELVEKLKAVADEKKVITDADIQSLVYSGLALPDPHWTLEALHVSTGLNMVPIAHVKMVSRDRAEKSTAATGTGPIDAVYKAIKDLVGRPNDLTHFSVQSVTDGQNALGEVTIRVAPASSGPGKRSVSGLKRVRAPAAAAAAPSDHPASPDAVVAAGAGMFDDPELHGGRATYVGTATDQDIVVSAAHAYVAALNRMLAAEEAGGGVVGAGEGGGV